MTRLTSRTPAQSDGPERTAGEGNITRYNHARKTTGRRSGDEANQ